MLTGESSLVTGRYHPQYPHEIHDDIKWKHFPRYWPFMRGIHRPVQGDKGQCRGSLMFSLIFAWINGWVNNREAGDLRRSRAHYYLCNYEQTHHWHFMGWSWHVNSFPITGLYMVPLIWDAMTLMWYYKKNYSDKMTSSGCGSCG